MYHYMRCTIFSQQSFLSSLSDRSCQTSADGIHHSYRVPPEESRDHPDLHRLQGAGQTPAGLVHHMIVVCYCMQEDSVHHRPGRAVTCLSSCRWHRDGLHHRDVWRVSHRKDTAVPHTSCHLSGRVTLKSSSSLK